MLGVDCSAAVLGEGIAPLADDLSGKALSKVFAVEHPLLKAYTADGYVHALEQVIKKVGAGVCRVSAHLPGARLRAGAGDAVSAGAALGRHRDS